jgi:phosphohistidine swiveling domain-containing protein/putative Ca2+/H+ antiporter (TMEM165/GDT1 family)
METGQPGNAIATTGVLADFGASDLASAGGKGANLGELSRAGFPVPAGFIITTGAYESMLTASGLAGELDELVAAGADGTRIRALFTKAKVPTDLGAHIAAAYAALGGGPVAVRSSATAEDLPGAAFAGQQDTYLNVVGEKALLSAVVDCWASLWTDRAIAYRRRQGIEPGLIAIAVIVQKMVPADIAGVMFSANPVTGDRDEIVIDASPGLGEAVVSGRVTPEHYVLDHGGRIREFASGGHEVIIRADAAGGTQESADTGSTRRSLSAARLAELAGLARRAEDLFGRPQDIEWAINDGRLHVLQARPITALPPQPLRLNRFQRLIGPFFLEMFQQRPYPLDVSGWMRHGILDMLHGMAGSVGVAFPPLEALLPEEDGVVIRLVPPVPRPTLRTLGAPLSVARRARRFDPARWMQDSRFAAFLENVRTLTEQEPRRLSWSGVVDMAEDSFGTMRGITELRISYLPGAFLPQLKLRLMLLVLGKGHLASALIAGAETRTSQANQALEDLAARVRSDPELASAFAEKTSHELLNRLENDPAFEVVHSALQAFLAEYGHRETVSIVLSSAPTWSDSPDVVLGLITAMLGAPRPAADQTGLALTELGRHPALRIAAVRRNVLSAVDAAKAGMAFREDSHFYATMVLPPLRRALLDLGRRLCEGGVLSDAADVNHLRFEELTAMADGGALAGDDRERYRRLVLERAAKRRELEGIPLLDPASLFGRLRVDPDALLSGIAASRGQATGKVRIIRGPQEFGLLRSGEILVCPYTNPSWTPLFQRAGAVVVDAGGIGSHAAIVAREYGIPAVMGTGFGTTTLRNGQDVLVDGTLGQVTAVAPGASS